MNDRRKVSTDALETLGTVIDEHEKRDAIHLAVEPVEAAERLYPGQDVGLVQGKASAQAETKLGIVDPFLKGPVFQGQWFWLVVYPKQIHSLRHVWTHPAFPDELVDSKLSYSVEQSEKWLREWIAGADCPSYETVMGAIKSELDGDSAQGVALDERYFFFRGRDAHEEIPPVFWDHVGVVPGVKIPSGLRAASFSCRC